MNHKLIIISVIGTRISLYFLLIDRATLDGGGVAEEGGKGGELSLFQRGSGGGVPFTWYVVFFCCCCFLGTKFLWHS